MIYLARSTYITHGINILRCWSANHREDHIELLERKSEIVLVLVRACSHHVLYSSINWSLLFQCPVLIGLVMGVHFISPDLADLRMRYTHPQKKGNTIFLGIKENETEEVSTGKVNAMREKRLRGKLCAN